MAGFEKRSITELQLILDKLSHMMQLVDEVKTRVTCDSKLLKMHEFNIEKTTKDIELLQNRLTKVDKDFELFREDIYFKLSEIDAQMNEMKRLILGNG